MNAVPDRRKGRRTLLLIALVAFSPVIASYAAYYWFAPSSRLNYGDLIGPEPAPPIVGKAADGTILDLGALRGKWIILVASTAPCAQACERALHATEQARTIQGRERDRLVRVLLQPTASADSTSAATGSTGTPVPTTAERPIDLFAAPAILARLPLGAEAPVTILILDPRGNIVLRYGADPDVKRLAKDIQRLLSVSQMG